MIDNVKQPAHYGTGEIECKDALKAMFDCGGHEKHVEIRKGFLKSLSPTAYFWWGCAFKYLWRWASKNGVEDLRKCVQCVQFLIEEVYGVDGAENYTCRNVGEKGTFKCSECGCTLKLIEPSYCLNCGRKVVE